MFDAQDAPYFSLCCAFESLKSVWKTREGGWAVLLSIVCNFRIIHRIQTITVYRLMLSLNLERTGARRVISRVVFKYRMLWSACVLLKVNST